MIKKKQKNIESSRRPVVFLKSVRLSAVMQFSDFGFSFFVLFVQWFCLLILDLCCCRDRGIHLNGRIKSFDWPNLPPKKNAIQKSDESSKIQCVRNFKSNSNSIQYQTIMEKQTNI